MAKTDRLARLKHLERIKAEKKVEVPRSFADYSVTVDKTDWPAGITLLDDGKVG